MLICKLFPAFFWLLCTSITANFGSLVAACIDKKLPFLNEWEHFVNVKVGCEKKSTSVKSEQKSESNEFYFIHLGLVWNPSLYGNENGLYEKSLKTTNHLIMIYIYTRGPLDSFASHNICNKRFSAKRTLRALKVSAKKGTFSMPSLQPIKSIK